MPKKSNVRQGSHRKFVRIEKQGSRVWANPEMESLRTKECLCFSCSKNSTCPIAAEGLALCRRENIAFIVTRCPKFKEDK